MHRLAFGNVDDGSVFIIQVFTKGRSAAPYTCFYVKSSRFKREVGAEELDKASAGSKIESLTIYVSRKVSVKVTKDRIKVDFDHRIIDRLVRNVLDLDPGLIPSGERRRLATL